MLSNLVKAEHMKIFLSWLIFCVPRKLEATIPVHLIPEESPRQEWKKKLQQLHVTTMIDSAAPLGETKRGDRVSFRPDSSLTGKPQQTASRRSPSKASHLSPQLHLQL